MMLCKVPSSNSIRFQQDAVIIIMHDHVNIHTYYKPVMILCKRYMVLNNNNYNRML